MTSSIPRYLWLSCEILKNIHRPSRLERYSSRSRRRSKAAMATGRDHRDLNLTKRDENLVFCQVSLKDIWEALMEK
jgi:hypothetical protein